MYRTLQAIVLNGNAAVQVVACVNWIEADSGIFDWAAYVGVGSELEIADHGNKLLDRWAAAFFPDLPIELYRK